MPLLVPDPHNQAMVITPRMVEIHITPKLIYKVIRTVNHFIAHLHTTIVKNGIYVQNLNGT